jgi:hypothetical protein
MIKPEQRVLSYYLYSELEFGIIEFLQGKGYKLVGYARDNAGVYNSKGEKISPPVSLDLLADYLCFDERWDFTMTQIDLDLIEESLQARRPAERKLVEDLVEYLKSLDFGRRTHCWICYA